MNPIDALNVLEKKIEILIHQIEILRKENNELNNLLLIEREKVSSLEHEITMLKKEKNTSDYSKQEIRSRIEGLINKLSGGTLPSASEMDYSSKKLVSVHQNNSGSFFNRSGGIDMMDDDTPGYGFNEI